MVLVGGWGCDGLGWGAGWAGVVVVVVGGGKGGQFFFFFFFGGGGGGGGKGGHYSIYLLVLWNVLLISGFSFISMFPEIIKLPEWNIIRLYSSTLRLGDLYMHRHHGTYRSSDIGWYKMSRTGKTPGYNHVWHQQNQAKICPRSGESPKVSVVSLCVSKSAQAPSLYLHRWWVIGSWGIGNKLQWNSRQNTKSNTKFFTQENELDNLVC